MPTTARKQPTEILAYLAQHHALQRTRIAAILAALDNPQPPPAPVPEPAPQPMVTARPAPRQQPVPSPHPKPAVDLPRPAAIPSPSSFPHAGTHQDKLDWCRAATARLTAIAPFETAIPTGQRFPTEFPFVHCQQVARPSRIFLSQTFPAESALLPSNRQKPSSRCPEIPFAGICRCQGRASRRACMLRPHPRPDRHARLQPSERPDVGARGLLARDPVASEVRPAGAGRRGSGPGAEPALALRRGEGAVGHADARAARRGRPPLPPPLRSGGVHAALQRGKVLEGRTASGGRLPVAADGTGRRSSRKAVCRRRPRQDPPRRVEDLLPSGTGRGDRPSRPRRGVPAGAGAGPERGRQEEERLRAERLEAAPGGPPPGASAHEGGRRRGRAGVQRPARHAA